MTTLSALEAHRLWAPTYAATPNPLLALESRITTPLLPDLAGRVVVDVAAGTGRWTRYAVEHGAWAVAVDLCQEMLVHAGATVVLADGAHLPISSGSADVSICAFGLSYMGPGLDELARITRPGGTVIVSDMHPEAIASGWTRSFSVGSQRIAIEHINYSLAELRSPDLRLESLVEAAFGAEEFPYFERAGKPGLFEAASGVRAAFAAKWIRV